MAKKAYVKRYINTGNACLEVAVADGVAQGDLVLSEGVFGIAVLGNASGSTVRGTLEGAVGDEIATGQITTANTFTVGAKIYWNATAKLLTATATSNTLVGITTVAKDANDWICFRKTFLGGNA